MNDVTEFHIGSSYTNDQIRFALGLENLGGIRPSLGGRKELRHVAVLTATTDSRKVIAENPYHDRIEGDVLTYTAQGKEGDQTLAGRNKRLLEQYQAPVPLFGFANVGRQTYRFLGLLELLRHSPEVQLDRRGVMRKVWMFEFRIHTEPTIVPITEAATITASLLSEARRLNPLNELDRVIEPLADTGGSSLIETAAALETRRALFEIAPFRFEHLVKAVLEGNGFVKVTVTPRSGDGGIDVDAHVSDANDFLGGCHVQSQVKRWRHAVGSVELNHFRGALSSTARGLFITTSHYTRAAIAESRHAAKPSITLIDGDRLVSIIRRMEIDLSTFV